MIISKKIMALMAVLLLLMSPVIAQEDLLEFGHKEALDNLDLVSKIKLKILSASPFTVAGEQRECSVTPDESKITTGSMVVSCSGNEALINWYVINSDGSWSFMGETTAPKSISFGGQWAYECYYCPEQVTECVSGERECISETWQKTCLNGEWDRSSCPVLTFCDSGLCRGGCTYDGECIAQFGANYRCQSNRCVFVPPPPTPEPTTPDPVDDFIRLVNQGVSISTVEDCIITKIKIKNEGSSMKGTNIIEMQPRPKGAQSLAIVGNQRTCDITHPENVHRSFSLNNGESTIISLEACNLNPGEYDIFLMSRDQCWTIGQGNIKTDPFPFANLAGTQIIKGSSPNLNVWFIGIFALIVILGIILLVRYLRNR